MSSQQLYNKASEPSINLVEDRDDEFNMIQEISQSSPYKSQVFQKVNMEEVDDDEDDEIDILDGYLTYDMSEFHGMLGENIDVDLNNDSDSGGDDSPIRDQFSYLDPQDNKLPGNIITQGNLPPYNYNIKCTNESSQELQKLSSQASVFMNSFSRIPLLEGDEIYSDIDLDMEEITDEDAVNNNQGSDDDNDLNLFDSIEEELDENNDPYRIVIRYPNQDYKVNIFCPKMADYETDKKGNQIILRNSEILTDYKNMDEFYVYVKNLGIQQKQNTLTFEDLIRQDQTVSVTAIGKYLAIMRNMLQKWFEVCPTQQFQYRLKTFTIYLDRFEELINYLLEFNVGKVSGRRFQHGRTQFYFTDTQKSKVQKSNSNEQSQKVRPSHQSMSGLIKESKDTQVEQQQNLNEQSIQSTQLCVFLFKAQELYNQFEKFLHLRRGSDKYKFLMNEFKRVKSRYNLFKIIRNNVTVCDVGRSSQIYKQIFVISEKQQEKDKKSYLLDGCFGSGFHKKRLIGLNKHFKTLINVITDQERSINYTLLYRNKQQSLKYKNSSHKYLQFRDNANDYFD